MSAADVGKWFVSKRRGVADTFSVDGNFLDVSRRSDSVLERADGAEPCYIFLEERWMASDIRRQYPGGGRGGGRRI